jgi:hypothetical protein
LWHVHRWKGHHEERNTKLSWFRLVGKSGIRTVKPTILQPPRRTRNGNEMNIKSCF